MVILNYEFWLRLPMMMFGGSPIMVAVPPTFNIVVEQIQSADVVVRGDEGHHAMKAGSAHRTLQKAAQSAQI